MLDSILFYSIQVPRSVKPVLMLAKRGALLRPNSSSSVLRWYGDRSEYTPGLTVTWTRHVDQQDPKWKRNAPSTVNARFSWCTPGDIDDMPLADACLTFEHYVDWK